jgi:hypothetical protein
MLEKNAVVDALDQSQLSHYNPQSNRCYVELSFKTANRTDHMIYTDQIYDGQTGELLAFRSAQEDCPDGPDCKKLGSVFDNHHETSVGRTLYEDASDYIDGLMDDDRKR